MQVAGGCLSRPFSCVESALNILKTEMIAAQQYQSTGSLQVSPLRTVVLSRSPETQRLFLKKREVCVAQRKLDIKQKRKYIQFFLDATNKDKDPVLNLPVSAVE